MTKRLGAGRWIAVSRVALVGLIGGAASACSSDTMRFAEPFTNPFSSSERIAASQPASDPTVVAAMPTAPVQSQALPPIQSQPVAPIQPARVASAPVTSNAGGGWTAEGGTPVTLAPTDSLNTVSQRYGVPPSAILSANGLSSAAQVQPGRQIVIPVYNASGRPTQVASVQAPAPAAPARPSGQPKFRLVDESRPAAAKPERVQPVKSVATEALKPVPAAPVKVASADPAPAVVSKPVEQPVKAVQTAPQPEVSKAALQDPEQTASLAAPSSDFRWPARGRVIAGFGANGGNEGINIALPEGTPVKATEAGTVTYAGSEVKGYGKLVLIRHDNGFISAYAHNSDLNVKRGEKVKRGQVIATSGQTGNVTSPQLHFELRKGQAPVDPVPYLAN